MNIMEKEEVARLGHLLVTVFLSEFASFTATPVLPDITMEAICPAQDQCSRAIFLSGFQQAVRSYIYIYIYLSICYKHSSIRSIYYIHTN